jgi:predicted nuclease of restriction endonuclease-like (RecB) superfamily
MTLDLPADYPQLLSDLKTQIREAQIRASLAVHHELVFLYWQIGRSLEERMVLAGWGTKLITQLARDLKLEFPDVQGFSPRNLRYMRVFAQAWQDPAILQAVLAKLSWYHNIALIEKLETRELRLWYAQKTLEDGWSRNVLVMQIESQAHHRFGAAQTNFATVLPKPFSDLAQSLLKDPYQFDFLTHSQAAHERDFERHLVQHLKNFMLELGAGFAFMGNQYRLEVEGNEFFLDLLFYHVKLRCYIVIELKVTDFEPEYVGKLNFYLAAVDNTLRHPQDAPSIGLLLCKTKKKTIVEYALQGIETPIGISTYQLASVLPENLEGVLPSVQQLEAELDKVFGSEP